LGSHEATTRFVLELTEDVPYRVFTLADPFRVVIDLPKITWPDAGTVPQLTGVVEALRFGSFEPGTSRVVLDVAQPTAIEGVFMLAPQAGKPQRFVLDLKPVSRAAYFAQRPREPFASATPMAPPQPAIATLVPPRKPSRTKPVVVIDAGHGGVDPGAIGPGGAKEKEMTLAYAKALQAALQAEGTYHVVLTREDDRFIQLRDRIKIAERAGADLLISLHINTHRSHTVRGASVYTVSEKASDREAARLAAAENAADEAAGVNFTSYPDDVKDILRDLTARETKNLSNQLAETLIAEVGKNAVLLPNTHRFAGFVVLKSLTVPSILFEIGYLSHPEEARALNSKTHRDKVVAAMQRAIDRYFAWQQTVSRS
ncbi:MAG TPA: N-acetylmuramoyl-L-alanine amidase, partial [Kiloniellaceae bacterium]|nr:N-acetylmuramoyl-L-alanine amidase [Kiloniellaceae bacterium]